MADYTGMPGSGNPLGEERRDIRYIRDVLWPEFLRQFIEDNREYPEDRPLGARAEWHGLHRKVGKLQAPVWDGKEWTGRESVRRMFQEIVGHAFLAIASLDYDGANCSSECGESHTYGVGCSVGRMLRKPPIETIPPVLGFMVSADSDGRVKPWPGNRPFDIQAGKLVPVEDGVQYADETEAYSAQRRERRAREIMRAGRAESRSEATDREAAAWRVRHCGPGCAYEHRYSGDCMNQE